MTPQEIAEKRSKLLADMRALHAKAEAEKRSMSAEEQGQWDGMEKEFHGLKDQAAEIQGREARAAMLATIEEDERRATTRPSQRADRELPPSSNPGNAVQGRRAGFTPTGNALRDRRYHDIETAMRNSRPQLAEDAYLKAFRSYCATGIESPELRAQMVGSDTAGGYLVQPMQMSFDLIQAVDDALRFRQYATVIPLTQAVSLGVPTLDTDPDDPTSVTETGIGSEVSIVLGKRELSPRALSSYVKVTNTLMGMSAIGIEALIRERLTYKMAVKQEKGFMTGAGATTSLGVFTASTSGISTGRDVSTGNTTSAMTYDGLVNAMYSVKEGYRTSGRCAWIFNRLAVRDLMKIKDGEGRPLYTLPNGNNIATLHGYPVIESEYAPSTFTTSLYVGLFGDLSYYWIAEAMTYGVRRLDELYAAEDSTGFIGRAMIDGMPVHEAAFARVKLA